ncbi:MAG: cation:proton antiporter [Nitrospirales bacterium]
MPCTNEKLTYYTSIGITVRVLSDLKRQQAPEGQIVLGAAVLDDILGVVLLALLYEFSIGGEVSLVNASKVLVFVALCWPQGLTEYLGWFSGGDALQ